MKKLTITTGILMTALLLSSCSNNSPIPVEIQGNSASNSASASTSDPTQNTTQAGQTSAEATDTTSKDTTNTVDTTVSPADVGASNTGTTNSFISETEAKNIAFNHAGIQESEATILKCFLEYDDGIAEYDVEFYVGNMEYDYEIDATTGEIRSIDQEMETPRPNQSTTSPSTDTQVLLTEEEAKNIALTHAGLTSSEVNFVHCKLDYDKGVAEYEVEFYVDFKEYDYEINATTGAILSFDHDMETAHPNASSGSTTATITATEAEGIALAHAGFTESAVTGLRTQYDFDDGIPQFEVEFYVGRDEYDYEIHGNTGAILSYEVDRD